MDVHPLAPSLLSRRRHRLLNHRSRIVSTVAFVMAVSAGCGGGSGQAFTAEMVSAAMTGPVEDTLPAGGWIEPLQCVQDGDDLHWRCATKASIPNVAGKQPVVLTIVCERETGRCISAPAG